ncbi:MAG TPA: hypothetical protein VIS07_14730 [Candidatus Binatia bacterium]
MSERAAPSSAPSGGATSARRRAVRDARCACGNLLAKLTAGGVELKCRRCKRIVLVPWTGARRVALHSATAHERESP